MKEATKIHQILDYVLSKAVLKKEGTVVEIKVPFTTLCNEGSDGRLEEPSNVDLIIKISTEFDESKDMPDYENFIEEEEDEDEQSSFGNDTDKKSH